MFFFSSVTNVLIYRKCQLAHCDDATANCTFGVSVTVWRTVSLWKILFAYLPICMDSVFYFFFHCCSFCFCLCLVATGVGTCWYNHFYCTVCSRFSLINMPLPLLSVSFVVDPSVYVFPVLSGSFLLKFHCYYLFFLHWLGSFMPGGWSCSSTLRFCVYVTESGCVGHLGGISLLFRWSLFSSAYLCFRCACDHISI